MTAREQGIDLVVDKFRGLAGPKGLPEDVDRRLGAGDPPAARGARVQGVLPGRRPGAGLHAARRVRPVHRDLRRGAEAVHGRSTASPRTETARAAGRRMTRDSAVARRPDRAGRAVLARRRSDQGEPAGGHRRRAGGAQEPRGLPRDPVGAADRAGSVAGAPGCRHGRGRSKRGERVVRAPARRGHAADRRRLPGPGRHDRLCPGGRAARGGDRALPRAEPVGAGSWSWRSASPFSTT